MELWSFETGEVPKRISRFEDASPEAYLWAYRDWETNVTTYQRDYKPT